MNELVYVCATEEWTLIQKENRKEEREAAKHLSLQPPAICFTSSH